MGCCGQNRAALRSDRRAGFSASSTDSRLTDGELRLEPVRRKSMRVRGPATGRMYAFGPTAPVQTVDAADGPILLRSGLFRIAR